MIIFEDVVDENNRLKDSQRNNEAITMSFFLQNLETKKIHVDRYKLNKNREEFEENGILEKIKEGMKLPITQVDGEILLSGRYPKSYEILDFLKLDRNILNRAYVNEKRKF